MYQNDMGGYPTADLHVRSTKTGLLTVSLEAVDAEGKVTTIARGTARAQTGGEQSDFIAYRFPKGGSIRVSLSSNAGAVTLIQGEGSRVVLPFVDHDENGYTGQISVDGKNYSRRSFYCILFA